MDAQLTGLTLTVTIPRLEELMTTLEELPAIMEEVKEDVARIAADVQALRDAKGQLTAEQQAIVDKLGEDLHGVVGKIDEADPGAVPGSGTTGGTTPPVEESPPADGTA